MDKEAKLRELIGENLAYYRKLNNFTQLELGELLNYSDKTISKWERGESLPDIIILHKISTIYGITLNDLVRTKKVKIKVHRIRSKSLITLMSVGLCWLVATICYALLGILLPELNNTWLSFIYAIPVSMIVLIIFSALWGNNLHLFLSVSVLIWTVPLSIYLSIDVERLWLLFLIIIPLQILTILWFIFKRGQKGPLALLIKQMMLMVLFPLKTP